MAHLNSFFDLEDGTDGPNMLGEPDNYCRGAARFTLLCNYITVDQAQQALEYDQYHFDCAFGGTELDPTPARPSTDSFLGDGEGGWRDGIGTDEDIDGIVGSESQLEPELFGAALREHA